MLTILRRGLAGESGRRIGGIFLLLAIANLLLWVTALRISQHYPLLLGTAMLAFGFGLRHAVDADHIAAIDNVTRKLMAQGQRPAGIGFFFSIGHSTIVFALSAAVAIAANAIKGRFGVLEELGGIFGTSVSALFLLAIALMNLLILVSLIATFRRIKAGDAFRDDDLDVLLAKRGLSGRLFRGFFKLVNHSWQMYLVGFLFGLGFDTATEVGLLGIAAAAASKGLHVWSIMLFPALFAAAMALVDTADSVLMLGAYGWAYLRPVRKLFYNITITAVSVLVALAIGGLEVLGLAQSAYHLSGRFWDKVALLNGNSVFGLLGYGIIGIFVLAWIVSASVYKLKRYDEIDVAVVD